MPTKHRMMSPATVLLVGQLMVLMMVAVGRSHPYSNTNSNETAQKLLRGGLAVSTWSPCSAVSPWEVGSLVEGDLLEEKGCSVGESKMVITDEYLKWPNRTVPYFIEKIDFRTEEVRAIEEVIQGMNSYKCVRFREVTAGDKNYVRIRGLRGGCYASHWGMSGGMQVINLQPPACLRSGTVYHMLLHVLGFWHVHNNPVRDDYISIKFENVLHGYSCMFWKYENLPLTDYLFRYDYDSVMHASRKAYSRNGMDTIETYDPFVTIGQRVKPSFIDIQKLLKLYDCEPPVMPQKPYRKTVMNSILRTDPVHSA